MKKKFSEFGMVLPALVLMGFVLQAPAAAAERVEEATVIGKDKSAQAGQVPSDTRAAPSEAKLKKEVAPTGLQTTAPGVRTEPKMEKPKMADPEREKPEQKKRFGDVPAWIWIILVGVIMVAAG